MSDAPETEQQQRPVPGRGRNSRTIPATCNQHGAIGYTNLAITKRGGDVEFDRGQLVRDHP